MENLRNILSTILIFSFFMALTSCSGQTNANFPPTITDSQKAIIAGQPKIYLPGGLSPQIMFRCSMKDNEGNLWFGTTGAGIYKYDGKLFTRYAEKEGLSGSFVVCISQDVKGNIWAATDNGVYHSNGNSFSRLEIPGFESSKMGIGYNNPPIKKLQVFCVLGDKKGNIWFGTESEGLWKYDGTDLTNYKCADSNWIAVPKNNSSSYKQKGFVSAILEDKKGNIWFSSTANGLNYYDGRSFKTINSIHADHHTLQMIEDAAGNIWMATRLDGICRYNGKTIESFIEKDGVYDNMASCLYQAKNGSIWFGSLGKAGTNGSGLKGITVYDGKEFKPISSPGMRNNQVWTVVEDNEGNIWVGTKEFGLFRYDGKIFTEFTVI